MANYRVTKVKARVSLLGIVLSVVILIITLHTSIRYTPKRDGITGFEPTVVYDPAASTDAALKLVNHILAYGLGVLTDPRSLSKYKGKSKDGDKN